MYNNVLFSACCSECPVGFSESANSCYRVVNDSLPWSIAALRCQSLHPNAHLVTIDNQLEQDAVVDVIRQQFDSETRDILYFYLLLFALTHKHHNQSINHLFENTGSKR